MILARLAYRLFWTAAVLYCRLRGTHLYNDWPDVMVGGGRQRPYRECSHCHAVAVVDNGRHLLTEAKKDPTLAGREAAVVRMQRRAFFSSLPGRTGLESPRRTA